MTPSDLGPLALALVAGLGIGAAYFWGLWWTVQRLPHSRRPALLLLASSFLRIALAVGLFWLVTQGDWRLLIACLLGFIVARLVMTRVHGPRGGEREPEQDGGGGEWS